MGHLMDGGAHRLRFTHIVPEVDLLSFQIEVPVHTRLHGLHDDGDRGRPLDGLHHQLIVLHPPVEAGGKLGQGLAPGLGHVKDGDGLKHGDGYFRFLHDDLPVLIPQGQLRARVQLGLLYLLFEGRGGDDGDALFAALNVAPKLRFPLMKSGYQRGVGLLHMDKQRVVDAILVEPPHGAKVVCESVRLKKLLYPGLDAVRYLLQPLFVGLTWFYHKMFLSVKN